MVYRSKIDMWLIIVLLSTAAIPLVLAYVAVQEGSAWISHAVIAGVMSCFFIWLVLTTKYSIEETTLKIQSGPFTWQIEKREITKVTPTRSIISSPALSLDRLRIDYASGRSSILVSPKDKVGFVKALGITANAA